MTIPQPEEFDYNRVTNPDSEHVAIQFINILLPRITEAETKVNGEYWPEVEDRSSLRLDDRYLGRWRTGNLHGTARMAAMDALLTLKTILQSVISRRGALPMVALFPILRSAIESASLAVYLLEPTSRDERLGRSYFVAYEDAQYSGIFANSMGQADWRRIPATARDEILTLIATRATLGEPGSFKFSVVKYSHMVKVAEAAIGADTTVQSRPEMGVLAWWELLSGLSHAKSWAFIAAMDRSDAIVDSANESALLRMTACLPAIAVALERAIVVLEVGLRIFEERSKAIYAQVEDASEPPTLPQSSLARILQS